MKLKLTEEQSQKLAGVLLLTLLGSLLLWNAIYLINGGQLPSPAEVFQQFIEQLNACPCDCPCL